jgi:Bacterial Ig domain
VTTPDIFTPFEATDLPQPGSTISGVVPVSGWAFDDEEVAKVEILVDGTIDGTASYGSPRPDVQAVYPSSPVNVGFSYSLDTTKYSNGRHTLNVKVTDSSANVAVFSDVVVAVSNPAPVASLREPYPTLNGDNAGLARPTTFPQIIRIPNCYPTCPTLGRDPTGTHSVSSHREKQKSATASTPARAVQAIAAPSMP